MPSEINKTVAHDWQSAFPELLKYKPNRFYKVLGPAAIGIELIVLPGGDVYRPHFVSYPLWEPDLKSCFDSPFILQEMQNDRGLQFDVPFLKHTSIFPIAMAPIKGQIEIPLDGNVTISTFMTLINDQFSKGLVPFSPVQQAKLFEAKLCAGLYAGDVSSMQNTLNDLENVGKSWEPRLFEWKFGPFNTWLIGLREKAEHRDIFLEQVDRNKQKLRHLKSSELVW